MPIEITMPRLSDTMEEGTLVKWRVSVGDQVSAGQHLADVETDKATMELQCFDDGTVAKIAVEEGQTTAVGDLILMLATEGEDLKEAAKAADSFKPEQVDDQEETKEAEASPAPAPAPEPAATPTPEPAPAPTAAPAATSSGKASPLARKMAEEHGLDISQIAGSGPDGRVIKRDILQAIESGGTTAAAAPSEHAPTPDATATAPAPAPVKKLESKSIPLTNMRKTIAKRLVESKTTVPHFQVDISINADPLLELRKTVNSQLEPQGIKLTVNDYVVRAIALASVQHPEANSSWAGDTIEQHGTVNVGVAISLPAEKGGGLVVATIRDAQSKGLRQINQEVKTLAKKARTQGLTVEEMSDATITISNLGMFGVNSFNAIINPPNAAIIAVGAAIEQPVVRDGELTIGHEMNATLSGDHRVIDGASGAEYLVTLKGLIENPAALLV